MSDARSRAFVVTAYVAGADGRLRPRMPSEGVCARSDARACRLSVHHRRPRSTGPRFPLTVARCRTHRRAFTLYPPGHVPYGRVAVVARAPDGSAVQAARAKPLEAYRGTLFEAALDAAAGTAWHREHEGATARWWPTQHRRLALATRVLGLSGAVPARHREQVAELLGIERLCVHEAAAAIREAPGYRARGRAVCRVLAAVPAGRFAPERLLECGTLARQWGAPLRWLPESRTLRRRPFRGAGTHPAQRPP